MHWVIPEKNSYPQRMGTFFNPLSHPDFLKYSRSASPPGFPRPKKTIFSSLKAGRLNVCLILFLVAVFYVNFSFESSSFDRVQLVSDITKTVFTDS